MGLDLIVNTNNEYALCFKVQEAIDAGFAAAIIYDVPKDYTPDDKEIRIAFDGDAVIFLDESENIYRENGLEAFLEHERVNAEKVLPYGPFAKLLRTSLLLKRNIHIY
jgi:5'-nucleotidase